MAWVQAAPPMARFVKTKSLTIGAATNAVISEQTFTVTGLKPGPVFAWFAVAPSNLNIQILKSNCFVKNVLRITLTNTDSAPVTLGAINVVIWQP